MASFSFFFFFLDVVVQSETSACDLFLLCQEPCFIAYVSTGTNRQMRSQSYFKDIPRDRSSPYHPAQARLPKYPKVYL